NLIHSEGGCVAIYNAIGNCPILYKKHLQAGNAGKTKCCALFMPSASLLPQTKLVAQFPVEAGYFNKKEAVIPSCPLKMTIFGPSRVVREDRIFERLLNSYIKELPSMPASIVKSDIIKKFFQLRTSDMSEPGQAPKTSNNKKRKKSEPIKMTADSSITGPMRLRSYYAVACYSDSKTKFSFAEGAVLQVLQKDPSGWWMVDASGALGWAPASYLVPVDEEDIAEEKEENERLMSSMRVGARYISLSAYQASRDDEISFVSGAIVKLIKKYADGWWLIRYNGGEGFVPGSMFRKFDRRQGTAYVKNIRRKFHARKSTRIIPTMKPKW
ncbi:Neutrophil cytosol factor 1, partial [Geodia barretti]